MSLTLWSCNSSPQEVDSATPALESGPGLRLALANRLESKGRRAHSELGLTGLRCFCLLFSATAMWTSLKYPFVGCKTEMSHPSLGQSRSASPQPNQQLPTGTWVNSDEISKAWPRSAEPLSWLRCSSAVIHDSVLNHWILGWSVR